MNRRHLLTSLISVGALSFFGRSLFTKEKVIHCNIEDFWDTIPYEKMWEKGMLQRNVYRVEDYPTCSFFKRIEFKRLRKGDHFILRSSKEDYMGSYSGYGFVSRADSDPFAAGDTFGVSMVNIKIEQCWTEKAYEKHMILSGVEYLSPSGHYKNGVRIG